MLMPPKRLSLKSTIHVPLLMVQLVGSFGQDICNFRNLFLGSNPVVGVNCVTDSWEERLIIATPGLWCKNDMLELLTSRELKNH